MPLNTLISWLVKEKELGIVSDCAVLSTVSSENKPHSRVVAIREIKDRALLFFTQKNSRKVSEMLTNPQVSINYFLALQQRQVVLEGAVEPLGRTENAFYWESLPRERQLRFCSYASTSGKIIESSAILERKKEELSVRYENQAIPMSDNYVGFRFSPETFYFYSLCSTGFSEVVRYQKSGDEWIRELISP